MPPLPSPTRRGAATPAAAAPPDEIRFLDVWSGLRRNRLILAGSVALGLAGGALYTWLAVPIYEATASIRIEQRQGNLPSVYEEAAGDNDVGTEIEVLRSRSLAAAVVDSLGLRLRVSRPDGVARTDILSSAHVDAAAPPTEFVLQLDGGGRYMVRRDGVPQGVVAPGTVLRSDGVRLVLSPSLSEPEIVLSVAPHAAAVQALRNAVRVSRVGMETNVIGLRYRDSDAAIARDVLNSWTTFYVRDRQRLRTREATSTVAFLQGQLANLGRELATSEEELRRFREANQIIDPAAEAGNQLGHLASLESERSRIDAERRALSAMLVVAREQAVAQSPTEPSPYRRLVAFPALLRNQATSELLRALSSMENQQVDLLSRRSIDDPDVQVFAEREREIEDQLRAVTETYLEGLTAHVAALDLAITERGTQLARIPAQQVEFDRRARTPDVLEDLVVLLQTRLKEAQIAEAVEDPTIQIVDTAMLSESPAEPLPHLNLAFGLLVGLLLGGAVTLTRENLSRLVWTRSTLQSLSGAAVVGLIPRFPRTNPRIARLVTAMGAGRRSSSPRALLTTGVPRDLAAAKAFEAYSRLWTNLAFVSGRRGIRTFLITSPLSGDGKTVTAMNMALAMAHHGGRVLLVDGDLRRGVIHERFGLRRSPGLSEVLLGSNAAANVVHQVPTDGSGELFCLTKGSEPEGPSALVSSGRVETLLAELQGEYEFVILDSPPINVVTDAVILGRHIGGVVLVARAGSTVADAISYSIEQLRLIEAPVLAAVLNDVDLERDGAYDSASAYLRRADREYFAPTPALPQAER